MTAKKINLLKNPTLKLCTLMIAVFMVVVTLLTFFPKLIYLAEKKLLVSAENPGENSQVLEEQVQRKKVIKIVSNNIESPKFNSTAVLALDVNSNEILYQKNINLRLAPASTTKIMTGLVAVNYFKPADILTVNPADRVIGSTMGLNIGEKLSFRSLLYGLLLNSGNDAAFTIASNFPGGLQGFIDQMNAKVSQLNLKDTHFEDPAGFDSEGHYSSAYDLAIIAQEAINNPQLSRVVATKETFVSAWDKSYLHDLKNLNVMLNERGVLGIKTGSSEKAGGNFVGLVERDHHRVITVVMHSNDRFGETKQLMDWVYQNYSWEETYE